MKTRNLLSDIITTYKKHGWQLKTALLRPETVADLPGESDVILEGVQIRESEIDALWFSRPSPHAAEAWELRLISETPYALFERINLNEPEERRTEVLQSMEDRLREYIAGS
jgi:hypothetical protein